MFHQFSLLLWYSLKALLHMSTWQIHTDSFSVTFPNPNSAVHNRTTDSFIVSKFLYSLQERAYLVSCCILLPYQREL